MASSDASIHHGLRRGAAAAGRLLDGVDGKLLAQEQELYVFAQSHSRIAKERAMRRRQLKWLWARLGSCRP